MGTFSAALLPRSRPSKLFKLLDPLDFQAHTSIFVDGNHIVAAPLSKSQLYAHFLFIPSRLV